MKQLTTAFIFIATCSFSALQAQDDTTLFTLEDAVRVGLENNYSIKIRENEEEMADNELGIAKSVLFPSLSLSGGANGRNMNSNLTFFDGRTQSRTGARSSNYEAAINLDWTIFDGFGMFASLDKYEELKAIGGLNAQLTVLGTVSDIISTYYEIVRIKQELKFIEEAIDISRLRVSQANDRYYVGTGSKLELLNSRVDLNEDTSSYVSQQEALRTAKTRLNELLARDLNTPFDVMDTIEIDMDLDYQQLRHKTIEENPQLAIAGASKRVAELEYKEIRARRYPRIAVNSSYNFVKSDAEAGQVLSNKTYGLNYGITASMNVFSGFLQRKQEKNALLIVENQELNYKQLLQNVESALTVAYSNYQNAKVLMQLEEENREVARQNLDISLEMFRLGNITQLELREAQQNLLLAQNRYIDAIYQAKLAEIALKELSGGF